MSEGLRPAAVDDDQRVEQFGFPIAAPARLAPGQRGQRRDHRPHVFRIGHHVAEGGFHPPQAEHDVAVDAVILFDARQQVGIFLGAFLAGDDAPVRAAPVDVLPELLGEFRLRVDCANTLMSGVERIHHARVSLRRNAAVHRARAEFGRPNVQSRRVQRWRARRARDWRRRRARPSITARRLSAEGAVYGESRHGGILCADAQQTNRLQWDFFVMATALFVVALAAAFFAHGDGACAGFGSALFLFRLGLFGFCVFGFAALAALPSGLRRRAGGGGRGAGVARRASDARSPAACPAPAAPDRPA